MTYCGSCRFQLCLLVTALLFGALPFIVFLVRDVHIHTHKHVHVLDAHKHRHLRLGVVTLSVVHDNSPSNVRNPTITTDISTAITNFTSQTATPLPPPKYLHIPITEVSDDDQPFLTYQIHSSPASEDKHAASPSAKASPPIVVNLAQVAWYYSQPYAFRLDVANQCMQHMYTDLTHRYVGSQRTTHAFMH